jgi:hypothetical protein
VSSPLPEEPFASIAGLMSTFDQPWFLCGGWAVDAWLGRQTRNHQDTDIAVAQDGQRALFEHLACWHLIAHHPDDAGDTTAFWDGRHLRLPAHIHARPPGEANLAALLDWVPGPRRRDPDGLDVEFILDDIRDGEWVLDAPPPLRIPLDEAVRRSPTGVPSPVPKVLMYLKATAYWGMPGYPRGHDLDDFRALMPLLSTDDKAWLNRALGAFVHPWLAHLG